MPRSRRQKSRPPETVTESPYDALLCFNFYVGWRAIQEFYGPAFPAELNPQRLYVLGLCDGAGASVRTIADALHIDDAAVSNMLNRLAADGLVERKPDTMDRRGVLSTVTPKGRQLMASTDKRIRALDRELARRVPKADIASVGRVVRALLETQAIERK
jgi:DNA-binding MarR family transcriptional regulator